MCSPISAAGKAGVAIHGIYDFWSPSRHYQSFHGGLRLLTESASVRLASPITLSADQITANALGYNPRERSWNYLEPWMGGTWHLRDIIDYQLIAFESVMYNASLHREDLLRNFYKVGVRQTARTDPWGFVISGEQRDPTATRKLVDTLRFGQVEVWQGADGSAVIPMQQPYSGWAKALLERQHYPEDRLYPGGPPKRPYDTTAETLPLLFGVDVKTVDKPVSFKGPWETTGTVGATIRASDTALWTIVNQAWDQNAKVWRDPATGDVAIHEHAGWKELKRPRIALYQSWMANMDEGWTRWLLENFGFAYTTVHNADLQAGNLRQKFDAIIFPDQAAGAIENGYGANAMPAGYTGGVGAPGDAALKEFANAGGTLVFLNDACEFAISRLGVPARNVVSRGNSSEFYSPGSLLNVKLDTSNPIAYGVPAELTIWSEHSPAWDTQLPAIARYPDSGLLASGWLVGEKLIAGKAALLIAPMGSGRAVLFGMRPQYRAQSYLTFKLFFNSLLL